jgi:hypothetical protein
MTTRSCHLLCYNNTMKKNNQKNEEKEGAYFQVHALAFHFWLLLQVCCPSCHFCPFTFGSCFKCVVLVVTFALSLLAPSFALLLQALPSFADGVRTKWGKVGRREVGRREKLWGRKEVEKTKSFGLGRMCFWFIPKTAWMVSSWTGAMVAAGSLQLDFLDGALVGARVN